MTQPHSPLATGSLPATAAPGAPAGLNPAQRAAVMHGAGGAVPPGPLLVIAGAGSGKTNTLAHRVARLIADGADPGRILLLTFTRRAAEEMGRRVRRILAEAATGRPALARAQLPWSGTFHGIGARLLRDHAGRIGLDPGFTIHDREDSADLLNLVRHELGLSSTSRRFPQKGTCLAIYSAAVNTRAPLREVLQASFPWCADWEEELKRLFRAYVEAKQAQQVLDYDDLLLYWAQMVAEPALGAEIGGLFDHVLVDEYQDTNHLQAAILLAMKPDGRGLTVVGDDAQSIYAFRGATVRNILDFPAAFTPPATRGDAGAELPLHAADPRGGERGDRARRRALHQEPVVRARLRRAPAPRRREGRGRPGRLRCRAPCWRGARKGCSCRQQAVLFRAGAHSAGLELELARRNIPFVKYGGLKFLEAAHVKDVLALLRWAENPRDRVSGFRAIQLLPGMGPKTAARVMDDAAGEGRALRDAARVPPLAREGWREFAELIDHLAGRADRRPSWLRHGPRISSSPARWYEGQMPRLYDDAAVRLLDIRQLARIAASYPSRQRFLTELTLDPPSATSDEAGVPLQDEDYLILSTMHSAKGQEWSAVSVLNVVDGCIPSDIATRNSAEIEEELRLLYVAMTRAKDALDLVVPQRFYITQQSGTGDRHVYAGRSRFIPNALLRYFEETGWPPAPAMAERDPASRRMAVDLAARMREMWR